MVICVMCGRCLGGVGCVEEEFREVVHAVATAMELR